MLGPQSEIDGCSMVFVIDTSAMIRRPSIIPTLGQDCKHLVIIPLCALGELDHFKRNRDKTGFHARVIIRMLRDLLQDDQQSLSSGVRIGPHKGIILIDHNGKGVKELWPDLEETSDNKVLAVAKKWQDRPGNRRVTIITNDTNLRLKANAVNISARYCENGHKTNGQSCRLARNNGKRNHAHRRKT